MRIKMHWILLSLGVTAATMQAPAADVRQATPISGITFAALPGSIYIPARALAEQVKQPVQFDSQSGTVLIGVNKLPAAEVLLNGTSLVRITDAEKLGAVVMWDAPSNTATLSWLGAQFQVKPGDKRVVVDKATQHMLAYQGDTVVLDTPVSTGRPGHNTPNGSFHLGPTKELMHYSHLYDDAPMPFCVQVDGNVFIHGFTSVPKYPASHGCIRVPLTHGNPAKWFYNWVDLGTPVTIQGDWTGGENRGHRHRHRVRHHV
jgi:hypothetical protein